MSKQVRYLFTSGDGAQIEVRGFLVRDGVVSVNAPPLANTTFKNRQPSEQILPVKTGHEYTETELTTYAKDNGFTLTKSATGDSAPTSMNAALANGPTDLAAAAGPSGTTRVDLSWTGSNKMEIWRSIHSNANFVKLATMGSAGTSHTDSAVTAGLTYYYKVRIVDTTLLKVGSFSNVATIVASATP